MIRRYWPPLLLSLAVILLGGRAPSVTTDFGIAVPRLLSLETPAGYIATSPLSRLLDALTLLSVPQTIATFVSAALVALILFAVRSRQHNHTSWRVWLARVAGIVIVSAAMEAAVVFAPRPMARVRNADPNFVIVDFHSHTGASHDVRKSFGTEENRAWHSGGGFNLAWITDHVKFSGAVAARTNNPRLAGDGVSLLTGVEGRYHKIMSTIVLGIDERDTLLLNKRGNLLPGATAGGRTPVTIVALPNRNLDSVTVQSLDSIPHFAAIELIDAAPRGLGQFDREETKIRKLAKTLDLALVAASNNHGFGQAVAAWNLVAIRGWQSLAPDSVGRIIEDVLRNHESNRIIIVTRTRPRTFGWRLIFTLPIVLYQTIGGLSAAERISWLAWIWVVTFGIVSMRRRARKTSAA